MGRTVLCWLRNDLRIHDNEVLHWAQSGAEHVVPLYCFDPRHYLQTRHFGFPKTGPFQLKFLLESLEDLRGSLRRAGSDLIVRRGKPEEVIQGLLGELVDVAAVAFHEEASSEEVAVEAAVRGACGARGVPVRSLWGSTLHHRDDLPFKPLSRLPDVFTEFRKRVEEQSRPRATLLMPAALRPLPPGLDEGVMPSASDLGVGEAVLDERSSFPFSGGETAALGRVQQYVWDTDSVAKYKETRNGLIGAAYSTKLSAWLTLGCISPRRIHDEVKKYEAERVSDQNTYWVLFELLWRDYFKFVCLKYGEKMFQLNGLRDKHVPWKQDEKLFTAWKEGRTGVPFVDANMRELLATGFMSNRGRQNVASFLTKDLGLDWRMGAEWFQHQLIDHDVGSNYGNWQYAAGVGNDPREDRKFNMIKQAMDYDPTGDYVRLWLPELARVPGAAVHTPWLLGDGSAETEGYPAPLVLAPEWSKHSAHKRGAGGGGGGRGQHQGGASREPKTRRGERGVDFYFSHNKPAP